jgi:hypothetical protein
VGDRREDQRESAAIEAGGEIAQVHRVPVADAGRGGRDAECAAAAEDGPVAQRCFEVGPGDLGPWAVLVETAAIETEFQGDETGGLQPW